MATGEPISTQGVLSMVSQDRVVLEGVSWETYEKLLEGIGDGATRVTYDQGVMEIEMSPSFSHESDVGLLIGLVQAIRLWRQVPMATGGSTTHKRKDLGKGLEPDACFWIANEPAMRKVTKLDLLKHPAPDLVIEVDLTSRSVSKINIYARLGVPEIWHRTDRGETVFLVLDPTTQSYTESEQSRCFPFVGVASVSKAMKRVKLLGEDAALRELLTELGLR
ncbi:MAG: Uma2 family endonuclease [Planctomycetota bacterium]